jgi:ribosomal protein L40E
MPKPKYSFASITLGELLAYPSEEIQRHARGALCALQAEAKRLESEQDEALGNGKFCTNCGYVEAQFTKNCRKCHSKLIYKV